MGMPKYTVVIGTDGKEHIYKIATKKCGECLYFVEDKELCEFRDMMISRQKFNEACGDWKVKMPVPEVVVDETDHIISDWEPAPQEVIDIFDEEKGE